MWRLSLGILSLIVVTLAGCGGGIEWFPDQVVSTEPTPSAFTIAAKTCQQPSRLVESEDVVVSNVTSAATVRLDIGEYSMDKGQTWNSTSLIFQPSTDKTLTIRVRHTTAAITDKGGVVISTLKVGNTSGYFTTTINTGQTVCQ
jgi:hypothetical protein